MSIVVRIAPNDRNNPPGKLADAELHFTDGELEGLKLIGFAVWERRTGRGRSVTFPARQWVVDGEGREFALLRPIADSKAHRRLGDLVLKAFEEYDQETLTDDVVNQLENIPAPQPAAPGVFPVDTARFENEVHMATGALHPELTPGLVNARGTAATGDMHDLLTVDDVAAMLKVSRSWVYEHTRSRGVPRSERLPHVKIGKYVRFDARLIREFLAKRTRVG